MFQLFYIALVSMVALLVRCQERKAGLCQLDPAPEQNLCSLTDACFFTNMNLINLVKGNQSVLDEAVYQLRNPQNVTSVDDFYQELTKYINILCGLDASARAYMLTQEYQVESAVVNVTNMANEFLQRVNTHIVHINFTRNHISENAKVSSPTECLVSVPARTLGTIYAETYYITNKMCALLLLWLSNDNYKC